MEKRGETTGGRFLSIHFSGKNKKIHKAASFPSRTNWSVSAEEFHHIFRNLAVFPQFNSRWRRGMYLAGSVKRLSLCHPGTAFVFICIYLHFVFICIYFICFCFLYFFLFYLYLFVVCKNLSTPEDKKPVLNTVAQSCNLSYSRRWGRRITKFTANLEKLTLSKNVQIPLPH